MTYKLYTTAHLSIRGMIIIALLTTSAALALPADSQQPIQIIADKTRIDNQNGRYEHMGNVMTTQGSRLLESDILEISRLANGDIDKIIATGEGQQARYQEKTDPEKPLLYARADTIEYHQADETLHLLGDASLTQDGDNFAAPRIVYNIQEDIVYSYPDGAARTTIILQPREETRNRFTNDND